VAFGILSQSTLSPAPSPASGRGEKACAANKYGVLAPLAHLWERVGLLDFKQIFAVMDKFCDGFSDVV